MWFNALYDVLSTSYSDVFGACATFPTSILCCKHIYLFTFLYGKGASKQKPVGYLNENTAKFTEYFLPNILAKPTESVYFFL